MGKDLVLYAHRHANEHTALKRLGGDFTNRQKGWRSSLNRISKVYRYTL